MKDKKGYMFIQIRKEGRKEDSTNYRQVSMKWIPNGIPRL
jgi:hypothetical protein